MQRQLDRKGWKKQFIFCDVLQQQQPEAVTCPSETDDGRDEQDDMAALRNVHFLSILSTED